MAWSRKGLFRFPRRGLAAAARRAPGARTRPARRPAGRAVVFAALALAANAPGAAAGEIQTGLAAPAEATPGRFVQDFAERATLVLGDETLAPEARDARFRRLLLDGFDTEYLGRFALGRGWPMASPAQRATYLRLFREDLLRAGKQLFRGYEGETLRVVRIVSLDDGDTGDTMVHARLSNPAAAINAVDFRLRRAGGEYRIIDVSLAGFSMLNGYRTEFIEQLFRGGVEQVLALLRARTAPPPDATP